MANLTIPEVAHSSLILLAKLSRESMKSLKEVLAKSSPTLPVAELAKKVAPEVGLESGQVERLIIVLGSLFSVRAQQDLSREEFSKALLDALKRTGIRDLQLTDKRARQFQQDVEELLSLEKLLGVTGRALDVMQEHEHVWQSARVLTDMRPVFASDPNRFPSAFVLIHNLRIAYREGRRSREFFVALDSGDVRALQKTLERAVKKEVSLKSFAKKNGIPCLYSEPEGGSDGTTTSD
jgi:hypothetical protein